MPNLTVSSDLDALLAKQTLAEAKTYLGVTANETAITTETTRATTAEGVNATGIVTNATAISDETTRALAAEALLAPILDATFTGTTTIPSADITTADFNAGGLGGEVSWNAGEKTLDLVTGANGTTIQLGQEVVLYCRNKTGVDFVDGQVVKIVGATANTPNIELAIASSTDEAHKTFGVVTQTITAHSGEGFITLMGKVRDLNLRTQDGFTEGGLVYLSATTAGALTPIKPAIEVEIGRSLRLGQNNGTLGVSINNEASIYELQQELLPLIALNTAKVGITPTQASDITTNNAKVGITPAQASEINTALQPADPTLDSVTSNGATTVNDIQVGRIATLHPDDAAYDNAATGNMSASIGGAQNTASGIRAATFGGANNTVSGQASTALGGNNQSVIGNESEALGSTNLNLNTKYTTAIGTANASVGLNTSGANDVVAKNSIIVGGESQNIENAQYAATLGGTLNRVQTGHHRSVILGGANITTDASDTAYVDNLNVKSAVKIPTGAADGYVLTSDASGAAAWAAGGGAKVVAGLVSSGDNSSTIQAVIDSVAADGGGDIVIPAGVWEIASTLVISTSNVRLRGEGGDWNHGVGSQGGQAATTLKWIGTEFDGNAVISAGLDTVSNNGTRLNDTTMATPDVAKYQGMVIKHVSSGIYDLIMDSDDGYVEVKADSNYAWAGGHGFNIYKPSVMVEVKSVYGDGVNDQQIVGSGVQRIHFDCQLAHIGLRVIASNNGEYRDLSFIEPRTSAIYMGVKNIGSMDKPAVVSQDPQFNDFERVVSRNFVGGIYGGLLVCTGLSPWGSNTSFNRFSDFRAFHRHGDGFILGSSDANKFSNMLCNRGTTGTGHALKLLGANRSTSDVPRGNVFAQFSANPNNQILCYGTDGGSSGNVNDVDIYEHPSHDNHFPLINTGNGTPLPQIGFEADAFYDTDHGFRYYGKESQLVVGNSISNIDDARENMETESLRIANGNDNHMILQGNSSTDWRIRTDGEDLRITGTSGNAELKLGNRTSFAAGIATKVSTVNTTAINWWNHTYVFKGLSADITADLNTGASLLTGQEVVIKNGDPLWHVILNSNGKLVDGAPTSTTSITILAKQFITLQWDGTEWWIIGRG